MIWPLAASLYILVGGVGSFGVARATPPSTSPTPFDPAAGFALICGCIALWPVLIALAIARNLTANRRSDQ